MIKVIIERWTNSDSSTDYRWSVWSDGHRLGMGTKPYPESDECEMDARAFCVQALGLEPDKVSRL